MSEQIASFIQLSLRGQVVLDEIDDFVDRWHENPRGLELHDFLGMTRDEYALWVASPDTLACIVRARHERALRTEAENAEFG